MAFSSSAAVPAPQTSNPAFGGWAIEARLRILLVEDDAVITALLAELLTEVGHTVCGSARTEMQAVDAAARHGPDLMIVDVQLQAGSGVWAMESILRRGAMPHIFMTAGSRQAIPANSVVLFKPFGLQGLRDAMERLAQKTRAQV
jgi:DNA-binding response OmpR family regulator